MSADPPPRPARWRRHINCTNFLSTAFIAYAAFALVTLYRLAVPAIPPVYAPDGSRKHTLEPLWVAAPGLALEVRLSTLPRPPPGGWWTPPDIAAAAAQAGAVAGAGASTAGAASAGGQEDDSTALLLVLRDLPYAWNLSDAAEVDMALELPEAAEVLVSQWDGGFDVRAIEYEQEWEEQEQEAEAEAEAAAEQEKATAKEEVAEAEVDAAGKQRDAAVPATAAAAAAKGRNNTAPGARRRVKVTRTREERIPRVTTSLTRVLLPAATAEELADEIVAAEAAQLRQASQAPPPAAAAPSLRQRRLDDAGVPRPSTSASKNVTVSIVRPGGLRARCVGATPSRTCVALAASWRKASAPAPAAGGLLPSLLHQSPKSISAAATARLAAATRVAKRGILPSLLDSVTRALRGADALDEEAEAEAEREAGGLVIFESTSPGARKVAGALAAGRGVHAHATVRWQDASQEAGGKFVRSPLQPEMRRASSGAALVSSAPYTPAPHLRYLWTDLFPTASPSGAAFARLAGISEESVRRSLVLSKIGDERARRAAAALGDGAALAASAAAPVATPASGESVPHWLGSLSLSLVMQTESIPRDEVPPAIAPFLRLEKTRTGYYPSLTANPVRPLRERFVPLNSTVVGVADALPLKLRLSAVSAGAWNLMSVMDASLTTQRSMGATERDTDDVIRLLAETPLWVLGLTFVVSFIHMLFDVLAFKNELAYWSGATSLRGISVKSLGHALISQLIVSAYLMREGSSLLVMLPQGAGTLLLVWKMARAAGLTLEIKYHVLPVPGYDRALAASTQQGAASRYDSEIVGFLSTLLYPVLAAFALYQLVYARHASWLDWALGTAVTAVYSAGFIFMTPQLWVNYRLKSVAHLPWRVLGYRFFNTIIDDVFAAIIRMPLLHRISVFRDDVIFVLYMIQRWIYPVDAARPAEGFEDDDDSRSGAVVAPDSAPGKAPANPPSSQTEAEAAVGPKEAVAALVG